METIKELIRSSIGLLKNNSITGASFSRPHYPTCVVYFGKRSAGYHAQLLEDMLRGWGGNAEYIRFYTVEDPGAAMLRDTLTGAEITHGQIKAQVTDLLSAQDVFADMTRLALYCVVDTTDIASGEEFLQWYNLIGFLEGLLGVSTLSMLMVILNESLQLNEQPQAIKNCLRDAYLDPGMGSVNHHLYDSVFVLGNRLKNGSFIKLDPQDSDYENYNLFANIVLLTNTRCDDYNARRARLYGSDKPAITAAYAFVQKPMVEIVMISLSIILSRIRALAAGQHADADTLAQALQIDRGRSEVYEQFYQDISPLLPSQEFMNWLPGKPDSGRSFEEYNRATDGCLQAFLEGNHFEVVANELLNRNAWMERELIGLISRHVTAAQLAEDVPAGVRSGVYDKAEMAFGTPDKLQVQAAIEMKVKKNIAQGLRAKTDQALSWAVQKAEACMAAFGQLCTEHERMFAVGEEGTRKNLTAFYGERIQRFYSDQSKLKALLGSLLNIDNTREDMLQILLDAIKVLFSSDPVYKLSFSQELLERLGNVDTPKRAQEFIGQELIKNLDDKVGFFSQHVYQGRAFEAYLLNTEGDNSMLYRYLNERDIPPEVSRTFFNTCNNDMAESIWFYVCSVDNLSL